MQRIEGYMLIIIGMAAVYSTGLIILPNIVIGIAAEDGWVSYSLGCFVSLGVAWALSRVSKRYPGKDMYQILIDGVPWVGSLLAAFYTLFFFVLLLRDLTMISDFVDTLLLTDTPYHVVLYMIALIAIFGARAGVEVTARMMMLTMPPLIIITVIVPLQLMNQYEISRVLPFFESGLGPSIGATWYAFSFLGEVVLLPFLCFGQTFRFRIGAAAAAGGFILLLLIHFATVLTLGTHIPSRFFFPTYEMVRQIRFSDFLDRFELPLVGIWMPVTLTKIAIELFVVCAGIKRLVPAVSGKRIVPSVGICSAASAAYFIQSGVQTYNFHWVWSVLAVVPETILPVLLFFVWRPWKPGKRAEVQGGGIAEGAEPAE